MKKTTICIWTALLVCALFTKTAQAEYVISDSPEALVFETEGTVIIDGGSGDTVVIGETGSDSVEAVNVGSGDTVIVDVPELADAPYIDGADNAPPAESQQTAETIPAEQSFEAPPAEQVVETQPAEQIAETQPAEQVAETQPAEQTAETQPAETAAEVLPVDAPSETGDSSDQAFGPAGSVQAPAISGSVSGTTQVGSAYSNEARIRIDLGFTIVTPITEHGKFKVAEGSVQLRNGSWDTITYDSYIRAPYFRLLREATDSTGVQWYIVAAHATKIGDHFTPDGSVATELWLKKSDCTARNYIDLPTSNQVRIELVKTALAALGKQYSYGANGPEAFDCSGLVKYCMDQVGIDIPRSSSEIIGIGRQINMSQLRPGDICGRNGHVGIYICDGIFIHSSETSTGVISEELDVYNSVNYFTNYIDVVGD